MLMVIRLVTLEDQDLAALSEIQLRVGSLVLREVVVIPLILMPSFVLFSMDCNLIEIMDLETSFASQTLKQL
jgi:hypothetical protein